MAKLQLQDIPQDKRIEMVGRFYEIVSGLKSKHDVIGFFMGLLTPSEALMFARRIEIAGMLLANKSYNEIIDELGVGKTTIKDVARWLYSEQTTYRDSIKNQYIAEGKLTEAKKKRHFKLLLTPHGQLRALQKIIDNHM